MFRLSFITLLVATNVAVAVDPPATMTVEETADALGIGRTLAYELVTRGELPALRLGRRIVIPRSAIEELVKARTIQAS